MAIVRLVEFLDAKIGVWAGTLFPAALGTGIAALCLWVIFTSIVLPVWQFVT